MRPWLDSLSGDAPITEVADRVHMDQSTLNRQMKKGVPPDTIVKIARAYRVDPVVALVELGLITADEAGGVNTAQLRTQITREVAQQRLDAMTDDQLMTEVKRLLGEIDRRLAERHGEAVESPDDARSTRRRRA